MTLKERLHAFKTKLATKANMLILACLAIIAVFIVDLITPYCAAHWIFYLLPLFLIYRTGSVSYTIATLIAISIVIILGGIFQPNEFPKPESLAMIDYTNRVEGFFAFLLFTLIINRLIKSRHRFQVLSVQLSQGVDAISAEHERLSVTLRSIGDGVITTDAQGNIELMNPIAEELCGWNRNEAHKKPLSSVFNIVNETTKQPHKNLVEEVLTTGKVVELANHTAIISKDGIERIIADSAAPIRNRNNEIIGIVIVFRDMTEKQKLIETSQRNQKLESLGFLAGGIAHDFNNLMGGIFGYIDMAIEDPTDPNVTLYLSRALATIGRARGLTGQLLTFAKEGAPIQQIGILFPFVQKAAEFTLSGSNAIPHFDVQEGLWQCNFDKNQISQVINNLVLNAIQAMPDGGIIKIAARNFVLRKKENNEWDKASYVKISIQDQGIGMSKEILSHIFEPFFTTKDMGHGLGLATSHSIINRHGGWIDVESEPGKGCAFHVFIPAAEIDVEKAAEEAPAKHMGSGTVLLMDDVAIIRKTVGLMLGSFGYTVVCKKNATESIACAYEEIKAGRTLVRSLRV